MVVSNKLIWLFILIFLYVYFPFVINGGFGPGDDINLVANSVDNFDAATYLKERLTGSASARPISMLSLTCALAFYKNNPTLYIITQLLVWILTISLLFSVVSFVFNSKTAWLFILLAAFPFFSSTIVFSSYYLLAEYGLSIFFWAASLFLLKKYIVYHKVQYYLLSYLFLFFGLLSLSIILPLLIINIAFPIIYDKKYGNLKRKTMFLKPAAKYIVPVLVAAAAFFIFKIYITQLYQTGYGKVYGMAQITSKSFLQAGYYFFSILCELPLLLIEGMSRIIRIDVIVISLLVVGYFMVLRRANKDLVEPDKAIKVKAFLATIIASLIACSALFFLSNYPPVTYGQYNRMMLPSFILVSMMLSWILSRAIKTKRGMVIGILISILWISSMAIQVDNFIKSWDLRKTVLIDCVDKLEKSKIKDGAILIANVPYFTKDNYNNEEVFWLSWSLDSGIKLFNCKKKIMAYPVCWRTIVDKNYNPAHNINGFIKEFPENKDIWYYEFDDKTGESTLEKLNDKTDLQNRLNIASKDKINYYPEIPREKMRIFLQKIIKRY